MKFLCRNCKAKYQIADEKVAGRTLRMTCQQCGEPIVVRGPAKQTGQLRQASAAFVPQAAGAKVSAGLATDLSRHMPAAPPEHAQPQEEWHVAINDAPVGPLRRDEVARRIAQGVINRESLAWREGMDDWMQIKHIAELTALFSPVSVVPPTSIAQFAAPPPAAALPLVATAATRTDMAPIGGRKVVPVEESYEPPVESVQPVAEPLADEAEEALEEVAVATMAAPVPAPVVAQEPAAANRQAPGWAQMFALVSGGAFILAAGALLGVRVLAPTNAPQAPVAAAPVAAPVAPPPAAQAAPAPEQHADDTSGSVIELDMQAIDGRSAGAKKSSPAAPSGSAPPAEEKKKPAAASGNGNNALTAEQRAMLERMGGGLDQGPSNLRAPSEAAKSSGTQGSGQLTAEQLSAVVLKGRTTLTRCYETALRGAASTDTVRLDVDIQVSPNGNVTSVKVAGKGLPGMDECITRSVKMWRFPRSADVTQTRFPVVFQPGT